MNASCQNQSYKIERKGSFVRIAYTVRAGGGPILKGANAPETLEFVTGYMQVIPGLEQRLSGHCQGEKLAFTVPPSEAFGERVADFVAQKPISDFHFPEGVQPYPGMELPLVSESENAPDTVIIKEVTGDSIVVDFNHPLAGIPLEYALEIAEARPAKPEDICGQWESSSDSESCCSAPRQVVLGADESQP
jgi:FKBP-type peptidyl-prolyl cis-trans isomerase SlyD